MTEHSPFSQRMVESPRTDAPIFFGIAHNIHLLQLHLHSLGPAQVSYTTYPSPRRTDEHSCCVWLLCLTKCSYCLLKCTSSNIQNQSPAIGHVKLRTNQKKEYHVKESHGRYIPPNVMFGEKSMLIPPL